MSIINHSIQSARIIDPETIHLVVPLFVAIMVWITRILLIGSLTLSGQKPKPISRSRSNNKTNQNSFANRSSNYGSVVSARSASSRNGNSLNSVARQTRPSSRPEPEYISDPINSIQQPSFQKNNQNNLTARRF